MSNSTWHYDLASKQVVIRIDCHSKSAKKIAERVLSPDPKVFIGSKGVFILTKTVSDLGSTNNPAITIISHQEKKDREVLTLKFKTEDLRDSTFNDFNIREVNKLFKSQ